MSFKLTAKDYITYMISTKEVIEKQKDYITELDATTGDGDHWANLYMGFTKFSEVAEGLEDISVEDLMKKIGMTMLSAIGGSSGALYGSGYIAASKALVGCGFLDVNTLYTMLNSMLKAIMDRGQAQPGQKTMIDSLYVALTRYKKAYDKKADEQTIISEFILGANEGAQSTIDMKAVKGRASYRTDKGVGHLDPGAVTMAIQLECLGDFIKEHMKGKK